MLNGNDMKAFYRIMFPKRDGDGGLTARVPDVNETRLNDNFRTVLDEFRKLWDYIKNGFKTKTLEVEGNATIGGNASVDGQLSAGSAALGDTNVNGALDVDGSATFDSGVTIGDVLSVTNRRAAVNSASAGWHRVLEFAPNTATHRLGRAGLIIDFDITRFSTANETHKVSLSLIETNARFMGEESNSNTQLIDKIRYIYDNSKGYVDIHFSSSLSSYVAVDYQVSGCGAGYLAKVHTMNLADVADSPSGETVLTEYALNANGAYNGDVTVGGVLDVTPRRCYATLSSAGWYRVMSYTAGTATNVIGGITFSVDFTLFEQARECHKVTLNGILGSFGFGNEYSVSNVGFITKIRYTYDANNVGYVDIYYNTSSSRPVACFFDVHIRTNSYHARFVAESLQSVAASPSGETVLTEYSFAANTDIAKTEFTPTNATSYSTYGNCYYERQGRIVHVHIGVSGLTANATTIIASLPSEIIPSTKILSCGMGGSFSLGAICRIETNGSVQVCSEGTYALADFVYMV